MLRLEARATVAQLRFTTFVEMTSRLRGVNKRQERGIEDEDTIFKIVFINLYTFGTLVGDFPGA
jgi:hypothetical protein